MPISMTNKTATQLMIAKQMTKVKVFSQTMMKEAAQLCLKTHSNCNLGVKSIPMQNASNLQHREDMGSNDKDILLVLDITSLVIVDHRKIMAA